MSPPISLTITPRPVTSSRIGALVVAAAAIAACLALLALGCSSSSTKPAPAPDRIADLRGATNGLGGVMLKWSAPRARSGAASRYDIRLATAPITDSNWADADTVHGEPVPTSPGSVDSFLVEGLAGETTYHFAIRYQDSESHFSGTSNDAGVHTVYGAPRTIGAALADLRTIWNDLDYDAYTQLFDPSYTFIFAPQDLGGPSNNPASWGLPDELASAGHLFSRTTPNVVGYVADSVWVSFQAGPEIPNDMGDWKVALSHVFVTVHGHNPVSGDPVHYDVQENQANLWFVQDGDLWRLIQWQDETIELSASTWGSIKGEWR